MQTSKPSIYLLTLPLLCACMPLVYTWLLVVGVGVSLLGYNLFYNSAPMQRLQDLQYLANISIDLVYNPRLNSIQARRLLNTVKRLHSLSGYCVLSAKLALITASYRSIRGEYRPIIHNSTPYLILGGLAIALPATYILARQMLRPKHTFEGYHPLQERDPQEVDYHDYFLCRLSNTENP